MTTVSGSVRLIVPVATFYVGMVWNGWQVTRLAADVFGSSELPLPILLAPLVVGGVLHVALCVSFLAIVTAAVRLGGDEWEMCGRGALVASLLDAHFPLALWAGASAIALYWAAASPPRPDAYFRALDLIYWSRACAYVAAVLWFCSALSSRTQIRPPRALAYSTVAASVLTAATTAANELLEYSQRGFHAG
jgi:hypothetical protein